MKNSLDARPLVAEAIGTFALIFVGAGSILANFLSGDALGITGIALAHGLTLMCMIYAVGHISGGHINPAVTLALWIARKIDGKQAALYVVAQLFGAALAGYALRYFFPDGMTLFYLGTPTLGGNIGFAQGIFAEALMTFFLVFTIFGVAVDKRAASGFHGLAIGLVLAACILVGGVLTGASLNPARAFGPALASGFWDHHAVYWIGPLIGAVFAAGLAPFMLSTQVDDSSPQNGK